ncbi:protein Loquacious-like [Nomia melanderi]|uniref:protein Loquacious-like n=1 Tax=Nomia melanderi TaxID=2448451 RepID=UPI001303FD01|nr:RISC-loading complex subunit tarbp2-like [Nomia melanderi]
MDKTPISILQETVAKCNVPLPVYTEICMAGTHQTKFVFQVKWSEYVAKGDGTTKKEAKQNAAKEMIRLLSLKTESPTENSRELNTSDSSDDTLNNYVGLLQEHCQKMNLPDPCYEHFGTTGPHHRPVFEIRCTVASEHSEESASTKKIAKQKAAKKLLEHLSKNKPIDIDSVDKLQIEYKNLTINDLESDAAQQDKDILDAYCKIKELSIGTNDSLKIQYYHVMFAKLCSNISENQKHYLMFSHEMKEDHININSTIKVIQDIMKATVRMIEFKSNNSDKSIVGLKLTTTPVLIQIGLSNNMEKAKEKAVFKILECIALYMK